MTRRIQHILEIVTILAAIALILLMCASCTTDAMKRGYEQVYADIEANEPGDAKQVALTAIQRYGRSAKFTDATTTQDTIRDIQSDMTWQDYGRGFAGWLFGGGFPTYGLTGGLGAILLALVGKLMAQKGAIKDMIGAISGHKEVEDAVAKRQARRGALHKIVKTQESKTDA